MMNNEAEPLTRFCPSCGLVGEVGEQYKDCCPDGGNAGMVPAQFAGQCRKLFELALQRIDSARAERELGKVLVLHFQEAYRLEQEGAVRVRKAAEAVRDMFDGWADCEPDEQAIVENLRAALDNAQNDALATAAIEHSRGTDDELVHAVVASQVAHEGLRVAAAEVWDLFDSGHTNNALMEHAMRVLYAALCRHSPKERLQ